MLSGVDVNEVLDYIEFDFTENGLVRYTVKNEEVINEILLYEYSLNSGKELVIDIHRFNRVFRLIKDKSREMKLRKINY